MYKVAGKIFAITSFSEPNQCNLKCDTERAIELRNTYEAVIPGYHMNKKHWNTVYYQKDLDDESILELLNHSYDLVVKSLPMKIRKALLWFWSFVFDVYHELLLDFKLPLISVVKL